MSKKLTAEDAVEVLSNPLASDDPNMQEISEKIKSGEITVEPCSTLHIDDLEEYVQRVLDAIGYSTAWVSDLSMVSDFPLDFGDIGTIREELGIHVDLKDYIYQVAQRLKDSES